MALPCPFKENPIRHTTPFMQVSAMNTAFGNPKGDFYQLDIQRLRAQCTNVGYEFLELMKALGLGEKDQETFRWLLDNFTQYPSWTPDVNVTELRDALCDIQVFALGGQHFMGVDGDDDIRAVVAGVMTRFIKDEADKAATIAKHAAKGVTDVYFEGDYPTMVMKSARDQPDAPKGKFLKSASFKDTVFSVIHPTPGEAACARLFESHHPV